MKLYENPPRIHWERLAKRPYFKIQKTEKIVKQILKKIALEGDEAVVHFNQKWDQFSQADFKVNLHEIIQAEKQISDELKSAIRIAYQNIKAFHVAQSQAELRISTMPDVQCMQKAVAIDTVGLYIPGGTAPLFSTLLMLGVPAQIAGCKKIVVCTPANKDGKIHPAILFVADLLKLEYLYKIGGAQAIGAMAYGTENVPKCDKIFGPGNQYVTMAKVLVSQNGTGIDLPAGPSELLVLANQSGKAEFIASDLLSQAEHGTDSQVILVSTDLKLIQKVKREIKLQANVLPRKATILAALKNSRALFFSNIDEAWDFANFYAPEHLIIAMDNAALQVEKVRNAGSVFLGHYTPESAGDYASGTNHTLPTGAYARCYSGVNWDSFVKKITFQAIGKQGLKNIGKTISVMAEAEGLDAHKNAVEIRLASL